MFYIDRFITDLVTFRFESVFEPDVQADAESLIRQYYKCVA